MQKPGFFTLFGSACLMATLYITQASQLERSSSPTRNSASTTQPNLTLKGDDLKGAILTITSHQNTPLKLKITNVEVDPQDPERDTYLYTMLYQDSTTQQWHNLCPPDNNNVSKAIPLSGRWDETGTHVDTDEITFACTNGALAKCVRWGYKPWKTVNGQSLRALHQACTRMVRADYCGNGHGYTKDGTPIDVYDRLQIQQRTVNNGMAFEAAWTPNGAHFIQRVRWSEMQVQVQKDCPDRLSHSRSNSSIEAQLHSSEALLFNDSYVR